MNAGYTGSGVTMASKHGYVDKGSIRNIMVVMKRSSRGEVLVDLRAANLYQGLVWCVLPTTAIFMIRLWLICVIAPIYLQHERKRVSPQW